MSVGTASANLSLNFIANWLFKYCGISRNRPDMMTVTNAMYYMEQAKVKNIANFGISAKGGPL